MQQAPLDTIETLATRFGLPHRTVVREVMRGRLPYVSVAGSWRFRARDIEVWLDRTGPLPRMQLVAGGRQGRPRTRSHHRSGASGTGAADSAGQEWPDPATRR